ncbi:MAG: hypothetical protein MUF00_10815 [Gemmatimonadaceae bacterium]|jgi:hypothetical protein|nr:hypothetical protein [Gemmatimonadaceae bacterium]
MWDRSSAWFDLAVILGVVAVSAGIEHLWWLPTHGISGWTAELHDKYLALVARRSALRSE